MSVSSLEPAPCMNHPRRVTGLRCGKCGNPICTACMVQTPVGVRCRSCAQLKRLPQFDIGGLLLARSFLVGLVVSVAVWIPVAAVSFLSFFLAILVGAAVGEVMSRMANRRTGLVLEVAAVVAVVLGMLVVDMLLGRLPALAVGAIMVPGFVLTLLLPAVVASFVAVLKLR